MYAEKGIRIAAVVHNFSSRVVNRLLLEGFLIPENCIKTRSSSENTKAKSFIFVTYTSHTISESKKKSISFLV
jgi:hypothetical protein